MIGEANGEIRFLIKSTDIAISKLMGDGGGGTALVLPLRDLRTRQES